MKIVTLGQNHCSVHMHIANITLQALMQCSKLPQCDDAVLFYLIFFFTPKQFTLNHFSLNILPHWHFLQQLLHWVDFGELCLTEQPLALLQSKRLTADFFYLRLPLARSVCCLARVFWRHTNSQTSSYTHYICPRLTSAFLERNRPKNIYNACNFFFFSNQMLIYGQINGMLVCCKPGTHFGGTKLNFQMDQYMYKWKSDGIYFIKVMVFTSSTCPLSAFLLYQAKISAFVQELKKLIDLPGPHFRELRHQDAHH